MENFSSPCYISFLPSMKMGAIQFFPHGKCISQTQLTSCQLTLSQINGAHCVCACRALFPASIKTVSSGCCSPESRHLHYLQPTDIKANSVTRDRRLAPPLVIRNPAKAHHLHNGGERQWQKRHAGDEPEYTSRPPQLVSHCRSLTQSFQD